MYRKQKSKYSEFTTYPHHSEHLKSKIIIIMLIINSYAQPGTKYCMINCYHVKSDRNCIDNSRSHLKVL